MAFRQSALPALSRRYSSPSEHIVDDQVLVSIARGRSSNYGLHLGPISDFGSLNTIPQSGEEEELSDEIQDVIDDLDSLDEGLQEFQEPPISRLSDIQNAAILPAHDGLGSFHPAALGQSTLLQGDASLTSQFEPFSRFDDLRRRRKEEELLESSRDERIERWRLEQSKVLLEEIEKERQRAEARQRLRDGKHASSWTKQDGGSILEHVKLEETGNESIWQRLARHVMKDVIGLDDAVLSAIFGEDLMPDEDLSKTPTAAVPISMTKGGKSDESSLFQNLIKELRQLAQALSTDKPIAQDRQTERLDYAGMPLAWLEKQETEASQSLNPTSSAQFKPTLQASNIQTISTQAEPLAAESEYWEQTPNLKTVISYLYRRFRSSPTITKPHNTSSHSVLRAQDAVHRAAMIQQHHPLTSRRHHHYHHHNHPFHSRNKRNYHHRQPSILSSQKLGATGFKRPGSSCASWSTKRSRRGESSGSRNYWDIGGESAASGSLVFAGVGAWGEV